MMWIVIGATLALVVSGIMWRRTSDADTPGHPVWKGGTVIGAAGLVGASTFAVIPSAKAEPPKDLIVSSDAVLPAAATCPTTRVLNTASMDYADQKWSTSLSTPFAATSPSAVWKEFTAELCTNPSLGDAYAQMFQNITVTIGDKTWNIGDLNPWLKAMTKKGDTLRTSWTTTSKDGTVLVTPAYRRNVEKELSLMLPFKQQGVKSERSTLNWPANNLAAGELPHAVKASKPASQEHYKALMFKYTHKSGQCDASWGINLGDKRPETFSLCHKHVNAPVAPAPTTHRPKPSHSTTSTTPPERTTTHTPPPTKSTPPPTHSTPPPTKSTPPPTHSTPPPTKSTPPPTHSTPPPTSTSKAPPSGPASPPGATGGTTSGPASPSPTRPVPSSSAPVGTPTVTGTAPGATLPPSSQPPRSSTATDTVTGAPSGSNAPTNTTIGNPDESAVGGGFGWSGFLGGLGGITFLVLLFWLRYGRTIRAKLESGDGGRYGRH